VSGASDRDQRADSEPGAMPEIRGPPEFRRISGETRRTPPGFTLGGAGSSADFSAKLQPLVSMENRPIFPRNRVVRFVPEG